MDQLGMHGILAAPPASLLADAHFPKPSGLQPGEQRMANMAC